MPRKKKLMLTTRNVLRPVPTTAVLCSRSALCTAEVSFDESTRRMRCHGKFLLPSSTSGSTLRAGRHSHAVPLNKQAPSGSNEKKKWRNK